MDCSYRMDRTPFEGPHFEIQDILCSLQRAGFYRLASGTSLFEFLFPIYSPASGISVSMLRTDVISVGLVWIEAFFSVEKETFSPSLVQIMVPCKSLR